MFGLDLDQTVGLATAVPCLTLLAGHLFNIARGKVTR